MIVNQQISNKLKQKKVYPSVTIPPCNTLGKGEKPHHLHKAMFPVQEQGVLPPDSEDPH